MTQLRKYLTFLCSLLLLIGLVGCSLAKAPGEATPAKVLTRMTAAVKALDLQEIALCQSAYVRDNPDAAKSLAAVYKLNPISKQLVIDGVKKYGAKAFVYALSGNGMMFLAQGADDPERMNTLFLTKGKLKVTGKKAVYTYTVSKKGDEVLSAQPEVAQYQKALMGDATNGEISAEFVKIGDRWFVASPASKLVTTYGKINQPFAEYQKAMRQCLDTSKDIDTFTRAMVKPEATFKQAIIEAMKTK